MHEARAHSDGIGTVRRAGAAGRSHAWRAIVAAAVLACAMPVLPAQDDALREAEALLLAQRTRPDAAQFERAKALAAAALERAPHEAAAWLLLAWAHMIEHRFGDALAAAEAAARLAPVEPRALALMSDALVELGRYDEAVAVTQRHLDLDPDIPAWTRAAHLRFLHDDLAGAIELMALAARAGPRRGESKAWVWAQLARLFWHAGDGGAAQQAIDAAQQAYADLPLTLQEQARLHLSTGDAAAALALYERAIALQPAAEEALAAWRIARQLGERGKERHLAMLIEALARLDTGGLSRRAIAEYLVEIGDTERALALARAELAARPDLYSHATLARVLAHAGEHRAAAHHACAALALNTPDRDLQTDLRPLLTPPCVVAAPEARR